MHSEPATKSESASRSPTSASSFRCRWAETSSRCRTNGSAIATLSERICPNRSPGRGFTAPQHPGFYHLAIERGTSRQILPEPTLVVLVPFSHKVGSVLNGYRIGTYVAERLTQHDHPAGFVEVGPLDVDLKVSEHLRLGDFITHDQQDSVWPKYVALNPRLLDKLELVLAKLGSRARMSAANTDGSGEEPADVAFDVHSGYRTPAHNNGVWRAATDSRHEYGDAADLAIDADGDGRITVRDEILVARAVDEVEAEHPESGGRPRPLHQRAVQHAVRAHRRSRHPQSLERLTGLTFVPRGARFERP